jgi:hypothetical protein
MKYCGMLQVTYSSFSLNPSLLPYDLLRTSTCMHWCVFRLLCWLNDLLHTSHLNGHSALCMRWRVFSVLCQMNDLLHTYITSKWLLPTVYVLMCLQCTMPIKWLITYITTKWPHCSMYALMCIQCTLTTEWLITRTYITAKWPLPCMYVLMCLQCTLMTESLITYILQQISHFPVCMCWCVFRWSWQLNDLIHTLQ